MSIDFKRSIKSLNYRKKVDDLLADVELRQNVEITPYTRHHALSCAGRQSLTRALSKLVNANCVVMILFARGGLDAIMFRDMKHVHCVESNYDEFLVLEKNIEALEYPFVTINKTPLFAMLEYALKKPVNNTMINKYDVNLLYIDPDLSDIYPIMIGHLRIMEFIKQSPAKLIVIKLPLSYTMNEFLGFDSIQHAVTDKMSNSKVMIMIR